MSFDQPDLPTADQADAERAVMMTRKWVDLMVIGLNLCPFAKMVRDQSLIDYQPTAGPFEAIAETMLRRFETLGLAERHSTSLLILYRGYEHFEDYLDLLDLCQETLEERGFEGVYQLASFHPRYCFADAQPKSVENYTNRAPYPIIQILDEASVERSLANYPDPEQIPERNIEQLRLLGLDAVKYRLAQCRSDNS